MSKKKSQESLEILFRLIGQCREISKENTDLVWRGVNRAIVLFASNMAVCTLLFSIKNNDLIVAIGCSIILLITIVSLKFNLSIITRNSEHVYKYNKAIEKLERRIIALHEKEKWIKFLPLTFYENALHGTESKNLTKQVSYSFPATLLLISYLGFTASGIWTVSILLSFELLNEIIIGLLISISLIVLTELLIFKLWKKLLTKKYQKMKNEWDIDLRKITKKNKT